jgi:hypothetical protein
LFLDAISKIDQCPKIIDAMELNGYEQALKNMIQQSYIESNYGSQEDIGRGYTVQKAKKDACREDAPLCLNDPSEEQFFSKACHDGDEADIDERS